jgi:hypothetical protein
MLETEFIPDSNFCFEDSKPVGTVPSGTYRCLPSGLRLKVRLIFIVPVGVFLTSIEVKSKKCGIRIEKSIMYCRGTMYTSMSFIFWEFKLYEPLLACFVLSKTVYKFVYVAHAKATTTSRILYLLIVNYRLGTLLSSATRTEQKDSCS